MSYNLTNLRARALDFARHGIILTDSTIPGNLVIDVNPAFEVMTGYSRSEIIGRNCNFLQGTDTGQEVIEALREAIGKQVSVRVTIQNYRKDGEAFWNELTVSPIFEDGKLVAYIGVQEDVTVEYVARQLSAAQNEDLKTVKAELERISIQRTNLDERINRLLKQSHL